MLRHLRLGYQPTSEIDCVERNIPDMNLLHLPCRTLRGRVRRHQQDLTINAHFMARLVRRGLLPEHMFLKALTETSFRGRGAQRFSVRSRRDCRISNVGFVGRGLHSQWHLSCPTTYFLVYADYHGHET